MIGEAARAQNFSLYGYRRPTNPLLAESGIVALPRSRACSTYTTASLLCILSPIDTGWQLSSSYEPLPSYLQRHGIDVIWRTHNWGEPPLKVQTYQRAGDLRRECQGIPAATTKCCCRDSINAFDRLRRKSLCRSPSTWQPRTCLLQGIPETVRGIQAGLQVS